MAQITLNSSGVASNGSLLLQSNGTTTAVTIDTAQNMGLGVTPSAWSIKALQISSTSLSSDSNDAYLTANGFFDGSWKYINTDFATQYYQVSGTHVWRYAASGTAGNAISFTTAMTLDASGNLGVGITSPVSPLTAARGNVTGAGQWASSAIAVYNPTNTGSYSQISFGYTTGTTNAAAYIGYVSTNQGTNGYGDLVFGTRAVNTDTQPTERARITSGGDLLVGGTYGSGFQVYFANTDGVNSRSGAAAGSSRSLYTGWYSATSSTSGTLSFNVTTNGNVTNTNNSYGPIASDPRLKENITYDVNYLEDLMRLKVCKFSFKKAALDKPNQLGFLTDNIKEVFPKLIEKSGKAEDFGLPEGEPDVETYKASVLLPIAIRAIQEQQAIIQTLTDRITALEQA